MCMELRDKTATETFPVKVRQKSFWRAKRLLFSLFPPFFGSELSLHPVKCVAVVAEWLRRWTRNPLGSPRVGSNPTDYECGLFLEVLISIVFKSRFSLKNTPTWDQLCSAQYFHSWFENVFDYYDY